MQEYFGTPPQQALLARGDALRRLRADRSDCGFYGRTVGLVDVSETAFEDLARTHREDGFSRFYTGVASGNASSEAVCRKVGLRRVSGVTFTAADPTLLSGGRMTK